MSKTFTAEQYEHTIQLLGKPINKDSHSLIISEMASTLGEKPHECHLQTCSLYDFFQSGISLDYDYGNSCFISLTLHFHTVAIEEGDASAYSGYLPFDLKANDSWDVVQSKLFNRRSIRKSDQIVKTLTPLRVSVDFQSRESHPQSDQIAMITILFLPKEG